MATERVRDARGRFVASAVPAEPIPFPVPPCGPAAGQKHVKITPRQREQGGEGKVDKHWRTYFLQALAETSNVKASARAAGISTSRAYKARREAPSFAAQWKAALLEGYEHLEMEVLGYLRSGDPARKFDVASAIRLLTMHRQTVAAERAAQPDEDEEAVFDTIDGMIEQMRQRRAANAAVIAETAPERATETVTGGWRWRALAISSG